MSGPRIEILAYEETPLGVLCLRRREPAASPGTVITEITLNHEFLMSSYHTASERALATTALEMHPGTGLDVLIGGLGLGYTAAQALAGGRAAHVEVVELLPQVAAWLRDGLLPTSDALTGDPRFSVTAGDLYARLVDRPVHTHDLILVDVDHSPDDRLDDSSRGFYTAGGLARAKRHLAPGGVLGVWSYAESTPFADALHEVFRSVRVEPLTFHNRHLGEDQTDWLFFARD
jgi:spermidine synthase